MIVVHNSGLIDHSTKAKVEIDRRMLDFCVGLDSEFSESVEGSHLYYPKTKFEQVCTTMRNVNMLINNAEIFLENLVKGGKLGFPKIEGGQQHLANGKVIQLV